MPAEFDVIGLGVSTLDLLMVVDEFPACEVVQRAHDSSLQGGGPVATAMVTLARLGARTAIIDKIGDDWRGKLILEEFQREGVSTDLVTIAENSSSSVASILVRKEDGARTITYSPGDAGDLLPSELPVDVLPSTKLIHVNGRHLESCIALARKAKEQGVLVSFDGGAHRFRTELRELIELTDICIVAREFALSCTGEDEAGAAAAKIIEAGPKIVVITAGTEGSWVFEREGASFHQPAFRTEVVDTTGAGDAYHGAFLFGVSRGYSLRSCAVLASAVAAMSTRKLGGRSGLPSLDEVIAFLAGNGLEFTRR
jgi:sulfofructose kinase